jgi:hypothetical protein
LALAFDYNPFGGKGEESRDISVGLVIVPLKMGLEPTVSFARGVPPLAYPSDVATKITLPAPWDARNIKLDTLVLNDVLGPSAEIEPVYGDKDGERYASVTVGFRDSSLYGITNYGEDRTVSVFAVYNCGHDITVVGDAYVPPGSVGQPGSLVGNPPKGG